MIYSRAVAGLIPNAATAARAEFMAQEMLDISDDARNDLIEREGRDGFVFEVVILPGRAANILHGFCTYCCTMFRGTFFHELPFGCSARGAKNA